MKVHEKAAALVYGDRAKAYGHPFDNFTEIGKMWGVILRIGRDVTPEEVALCNVATKICREINVHGDDNVVDGIGYWLTLDRILGERQRLATVQTLVGQLEGIPSVGVADPEGSPPPYRFTH